MKITDIIEHKSYEIEHANKRWRVLNDAEILEIARKFEISPDRVVAICVSSNILPVRYLKNIGTITMKQQAAICNTKILVCGCGGLGGILVHLALRIGFGFIRCVDSDDFEPTNANRQWFYSFLYDGFPKVDVIAKKAPEINPLVRIEAMTGKLREQHLKGVHIVLDGLDNPQDRLILDEWCKRKQIPLVHGAVRGMWGQVSTILPDADIRLEAIYSAPSDDKAEEKYGILAHTVSLVASLQISEAVRLAAGLPPMLANHLLYVDLEQMEFLKVPLNAIK